MAKRVLVTGCAGFIGSRLTSMLLEHGHAVIGIDDLSVGMPAPQPHDRLTFHQMDICEREAVAEIFNASKPEVVLHLAAIHHIPTCEKNPDAAYRANIIGTQCVLDAATECERVVLTSSGAVYDWSDDALTLSSPIKPCDVYSVSKLSNEYQLDVWQRKTDGQALVIRLFNTIGTDDPNGHLIPDLLAQIDAAAETGVIKVGNMKPRRDFVDVMDVARAFFLSVEAPGIIGRHVINIGSGIEYSVKDIIDSFLNHLNLNYSVETDPNKVRKVDRLSQLADIKPAALLGWKPEISLSQSIERILKDKGMI